MELAIFFQYTLNYFNGVLYNTNIKVLCFTELNTKKNDNESRKVESTTVMLLVSSQLKMLNTYMCFNRALALFKGII